MIIECGTIEEFCEELDWYGASIFEGIVRVRDSLSPEQTERVTFATVFWATTIIVHEDGQSILEFGAGCPSEGDGARMVKDYREMIGSIATKHGLTIRGGKYEFL